MIRSTLMNDSHWSSSHVLDHPERGRPFVRPAMQDENPKRFKVTFRVFAPNLCKDNQVHLTYYGLDFKDCKSKMEIDTDHAVFKVVDVVDLDNNYHSKDTVQ